MNQLFAINWQKTFTPSQSLFETFLRGTFFYFALVLLLRFVLKRQKGEVGTTDLLVLVLLGDASQNAMAGGYSSITDGLFLVATLIFWSYALNWLGYHFPWIERLLTPNRLILVRDGRMLTRNLRRELITQRELLSQMHEQGVHDLSQVSAAYLEADGRISVLTREDQPKARGEPEQRED